MTFLVIIIAVLFQYYSGWGAILHRYDFFNYYWQGMRHIIGRAPLWAGYGNLVFNILPLAAIVAAVHILLANQLYSIPEVVFGLVILLYCLKADNLHRQYQQLFDAYDQKDWHTAAGLVSKHTGEAVDAEPQAIARAMLAHIASLAELRVFGVIFWFYLLGPTGGVIYYLTFKLCEFSEHEEKDAPYGELKQCAQQFRKVLDWLPQRLAALAFMLVGNFYKSWGHFKQMLFVGLDKSSEFYRHTALQALDYERLITQPDKKPIRRGIELIERAVILWLVIIAIITVL